MTRLDQVRELSRRNYSNAEIAQHLGLKSTRQVTRLKRAAGVASENKPTLTQEVRDEIRRLSVEEEWPPEEIANTLAVSYSTAYLWGVRGPGEEWSTVAHILAIKYPRLWRELRRKS